jgi:predicted DNA-binding transcriptional regulator YafY
MSEIARLYRYKGLLSRRSAMSAAAIQAELEILPANFKRDIAKLRDQLHVPIVFDRDLGGYLIAAVSSILSSHCHYLDLAYAENPPQISEVASW